MKYHISREQHFFFETTHYIEFEELLSEQEQKLLLQGVKASGCRYNLSYKSTDVKKITWLPRLARLAAELTGKRQMRFGFDKLVDLPFTSGTLQAQSCISPLTCALVVSLDSPFGHGMFVQPGVDLATVPFPEQGTVLIIAWAEARAQYLYEERDPHLHELKHEGFVFGDRLQEKWHPVLIR